MVMTMVINFQLRQLLPFSVTSNHNVSKHKGTAAENVKGGHIDFLLILINFLYYKL
jgi:hypothetical protein